MTRQRDDKMALRQHSPVACPVNAAELLLDAIERYVWPSEGDAPLGDEWNHVGEYVEAALRAACGGGDIVITASGALATLEAVEWEYGKPSEFRVVPVERGA